jgi:hypothetical protein
MKSRGKYKKKYSVCLTEKALPLPHDINSSRYAHLSISQVLECLHRRSSSEEHPVINRNQTNYFNMKREFSKVSAVRSDQDYCVLKACLLLYIS